MIETKSPETSPQSDSGFGERSWFALLCLVCLVILFSSLGSAALFEPDEGRNAEKAREILLLNDWVTPHQNFLPTLDKPMAYYWLVASSFKLFGISEWSARLPSVLAAMGCIFLVYRFARLQWGLWEALWSSLVLVTSVEFFVLSRIVIFDMTLTFFITLALFSFYVAVEKNDPSSARLYGLLMYAAMGAGTLIKGPVALIIPGMVIFCYLLLTRKWSLLRRVNSLLGLLVYLAVVAPWYLWVEARNLGYLRYFLWEEHFVRYLTSQFSRTESWHYFFMVVGVGFIPWTFVVPFTARNLWKQNLNAANLFLVLWIVLPFAFFSASKSKLPHYILPIYPALALLTGRCLAADFDNLSARRRILYIPWILILGFISYLILGAGWPDLLPRQLRAAAIQKFYLVGMYGMTMFLVFGVWLAGNLRRRWNDQGAGYICAAIGLALFWVVSGQIIAATSFHRVSKSLAQAALPLIDPKDRIVFYNTYMEGLPFYLRSNKPFWLVQARTKEDVMGSAYVGERRPAPAPGYGRVLFTFEELAEQWKKNELPLKVFVKEKTLPKLHSDIGRAPKILMKFDEYLLVTNRGRKTQQQGLAHGQ
jgi:4-amino-4-deoxy-L-arabinose transferase-like glycosyltransferase